jgi:CHAT domain-containing protein
MALYYPPNQIKPNLLANAGEFVFASNALPYSGSYHQLSNGKYYTEALHTNTSQEIIKNSTPFDDQDPGIINTGTLPQVVEVINVIPNNIGYSRLTNSSTLSKEVPVNVSNLPTEQDYKIGEFRRYFAKKINEDSYLEFNQEVYNRLISKDPSIYYEQYIAFNLPWRLTGEANKVALTNRNMVNLNIQQSNLFQFGDYLNNNYLKYYR